MNCTRCGHTLQQHGAAGCRVKVLTGWSETQLAFTSHRDCTCTGYIGSVPVTGRGGCPHEMIKESNLCVHCGRPATVESGY